MKLSKTTAQNSFKYSWLLSRVYPYIQPVMGRVILGFLVALPVGMLDGVVAFALKPYMDYVIGKHDCIFSLLGHQFVIPYLALAAVIPFGVVFFAIVQGVLIYSSNYINTWVANKITQNVKRKLYDKLLSMDTSYFDRNTSGTILMRFSNDAETASSGLISNLKQFLS